MTYTIGLIDDDEETNEVFESQKEMAKRKKARAQKRVTEWLKC